MRPCNRRKLSVQGGGKTFCKRLSIACALTFEFHYQFVAIVRLMRSSDYTVHPYGLQKCPAVSISSNWPPATHQRLHGASLQRVRTARVSRRYHCRASKKTMFGGVSGGVVFFFDVFFSANEFAINAYQLSANAWWRRNCIFQCVLIYTVLL